MEAIGKALAGFDPAPLEAVEGLAAVRKAGRVLSAVNEGRIREAAASLQSVLQTLPAAPVADDPITKEATVPADQTDDPQAAPVAKADPAAPEPPAEPPADVAKADGDGDGGKPPQVAVYDAKGNLVGIADPQDITPIKGADAPEEPAMAEPDTAEPAPDAAPAADPADMTPQPPADAGTPSEDVAKHDGTITIAPDALESIVAKAVAAALDAARPAEDIAKQADVAGLLEEIEMLKAQVATVKSSRRHAARCSPTAPARRPASQLRGQDHAQQGPPVVDVAKARDLKSTLYRGTAPEQRQGGQRDAGDGD